jgi:hypothetical protein
VTTFLKFSTCRTSKIQVAMKHVRCEANVERGQIKLPPAVHLPDHTKVSSRGGRAFQYCTAMMWYLAVSTLFADAEPHHCVAAQLKASVEELGGGLGHVGWAFQVRNVSHQACQLQGTPQHRSVSEFVLESGQGVGKALLKDAMLRPLQAADIARHTRLRSPRKGRRRPPLLFEV